LKKLQNKVMTVTLQSARTILSKNQKIFAFLP
jgi:hypothetical protein